MQEDVLGAAIDRSSEARSAIAGARSRMLNSDDATRFEDNVRKHAARLSRNGVVANNGDLAVLSALNDLHQYNDVAYVLAGVSGVDRWSVIIGRAPVTIAGSKDEVLR